MLRLAWRLLVLLPLVLLAVIFALSNADPVRLDLWPTDLVFVAPLSLLMLGAMGVAFLVGALVTWVAGLGARLRARRAERVIAALRAELAAARARPPLTGPLTGPLTEPVATVLPPLLPPRPTSAPVR